MEKQELIISFGVTCPLISEQLSHIKGIDKKEIKLLQKLADAITLAKVQMILSESESHKARKRIVSRIQKVIRKAEKW